jgi:type II secretory pathway component PulF
MPGFRYRANGADGKPLRGVIEARDKQDAQLRLEGRGWGAVKVTVARLPSPREEQEGAPPRRRGAGLLALLFVCFLAAVAAFLWFDPFALHLLEHYGLRPG